MANKPKFQSPTGMHDILPEEQRYFEKVYRVAEEISRFYGFQKIDTPIMEKAELFSKGIGFTTDIVEKQMYVVSKRGNDDLALRPEFTAGMVRAFIEHGLFNLPQPLKLYSFGPVFRAETTQAGRYRQFHQFDLEIFGEKKPIIDSQIILIFSKILEELKIENFIVEINSLGDYQCRPYYKKLLVNFLKRKQSGLCAECRRRLRLNPFRVLDCKEEKCQRVVSQCPQIIDHLCQECHNHFKEVVECLDELKIPYQLNPYLVRGLDYYTKTVFEIFSLEQQKGPSQKQSLEEFQDQQKRRIALIGGGRFDRLVKLLGGKDIPVCGGAIGVERVVNLLKEKAIKLPSQPSPKIFLAQLGLISKRKALALLDVFRKASLPVAESLGRDSLKAQLNKANKLGVKYTLILGQQEVLQGDIIIRDMEKGTQTTVKIEKVVEEMKKRLRK